ncbi:hypothetical protein WKV44_09730 [Spirochaetia bacterium 38H-sp]|uniref:Uncharacterized protein n=1 Tax=Rarispira pelagica TaxID=3141764 RepID=A0ABU9UDR0_9SPIR
MRKSFIVLLLFFAFFCYSQEKLNPVDENNDGIVDQWFEIGEKETFWFVADQDYDGGVDYRAQMNEDGRKIYEEIDFNKDGEMDDFYFYEKGMLVREEIDSNFDGVVDIWIFMDEGVYIMRYEQDTNFDGKVDYIKDYSKNEKEE